jgi:alkene monooxygenase reductase
VKVIVYADFNCVYAYLCGPPAMIDAAAELVTRRGVRPRNVYFDAFVPTG